MFIFNIQKNNSSDFKAILSTAETQSGFAFTYRASVESAFKLPT